MTVVPLDRQFITWDRTDPASAEIYANLARTRHGADWPELLEKSRVIILAEAGSGKSAELKEQTRELNANGKAAFYATVQDVAREGIPGALAAAPRKQFENWKASDQPAWFFIDSVDEAKLDGVALEKAFGNIADAIEGARSRTHVILSGRYSDWEYRADLRQFEELLPVPRLKPIAEAPTSGELLKAALSGDRGKKKEPEQEERPLVVLMAPLDAERIRRFADASGIERRNEFMEAIERANLWRFARRPLDLQWLVSYWIAHGRFGTRAQMIEASLVEHLKETNPKYLRSDPLPADRAMAAVERIGASFVFGRTDKLIIPDSTLAFDGNEEFDLERILPDWSSDHRQRLLTRAVFDPDTFGRVRLHNDNEGEVRSYLAARWLAGRQGNVPTKDISALLFADTYGVALVRPSLQQTTAWLSIWNPDVAREVIARDPEILLNHGDPTSLPLAIRQSVLAEFVGKLVDGSARAGEFNEDRLGRFSTADIVPHVQMLWGKHKHVADVRVLILRMIASGNLEACVDIAREAVFDNFGDERTVYLGGRALLAAADQTERRAYARYVVDHAASLPSTAVWEALESLFPSEIMIPEFLATLAAIERKEGHETFGLAYRGPQLVTRIKLREELESLLAGLLDQLGPGDFEYGTMETDAEKAYLPSIAAAAHALLELVERDEAPLIAIDAALRLRLAQHYRTADAEHTLLTADLHHSARRRQLVFWRAVEYLTGHPQLGGKPIETAWQLDALGWSPGLLPDDLKWLLSGALSRPNEQERNLAFNASLEVWRDSGRSDEVLSKIRDVATASRSFEEKLNFWLTPRQPTAIEENLRLQSEEMHQKHQKAAAERDKSWTDFIDVMRANPEQLRNPSAPTQTTVDGRLFNLWKLLESLDERGNRYAIDDLAPLYPIVGKDVAEAFRVGLASLWRLRAPILKSARAADKRNQISLVDCMGVTAISLEAAANSEWLETLSAADAERAAGYGTLELNGFPSWFRSLASRWPDQVGNALLKEIEAEIRETAPEPRYGVFETVANGDPIIARAVAPRLLQILLSDSEFPPSFLRPMLEVLVGGLGGDEKSRFADFVLNKFEATQGDDVAALYLGAAFNVNPDAATSALAAKLDSLGSADQTRLAQRVLARVFGDRVFNRGIDPKSLPPGLLKRLLLIAFRTIRIEEDNNRPNGEVYSPNERDHAQSARGALFSVFLDTPSRATYEGILELAEADGFPVSRDRMAQHARRRAEIDSEVVPWLPSEAAALELTFDVAPRSPADLQLVAVRRLSDMQHHLLNADFAQGATLKSLPDEPAVQVWVANELNNRQRRAYSIERESHVVDRKAPDIRLRAKVSDASMPLEIKIAESWTLEELESALVNQLGARYLRAQDARRGVLLLVHQVARPKGWRGPDGTYLSFPDVVSHLQGTADRLASQFDGPQVRVCTLDVSGVEK